MANKRQRKKALKKATLALYEGQQYTGGRVKDRKNLKRDDTGYIINQYNVKFTEQEKRALENAVNRVNRKRTRMMEETANLPRLHAGRDTGDTLESLQKFNKQSDFIIARKTKSLQRFKSHEQYEKYMDYLGRVNTKEYVQERVALYKDNHVKALENAFGDEAKDVMLKIKAMDRDSYMELVEKDEVAEIGYIYDPRARTGKLNQIRKAFHLPIKEESMEIVE